MIFFSGGSTYGAIIAATGPIAAGGVDCVNRVCDGGGRNLLEEEVILRRKWVGAVYLTPRGARIGADDQEAVLGAGFVEVDLEEELGDLVGYIAAADDGAAASSPLTIKDVKGDAMASSIYPGLTAALADPIQYTVLAQTIRVMLLTMTVT